MSAIILEHKCVPSQAKWAFTTRRVKYDDVSGMTTNLSGAVSGDLVLAQVTQIGQHKKIQLSQGRPSVLSIGDYIVLTCGDRYAPDQFLGKATLDPKGSDLIAGGGIIGKVQQAHQSMSKPTQVKPVGLLTDKHGEVINIASYALPSRPRPLGLTVLGVVGASMNAGKTTATSSLGYGLVKAGYKVAGIKATGTGAFGDYNSMLDAGLHRVTDFTDAGMASTYCQPIERIENGLRALLADASAHGADVAVVELADGIYQKETAALLEHSKLIRNTFSGILFACGDAVSVVGGVTHMRSIGIEPLAVSGMVSLSPLASAEAEKVSKVSILRREQLMSPEVSRTLLDQSMKHSVSFEELAA